MLYETALASRKLVHRQNNKQLQKKKSNQYLTKQQQQHNHLPLFYLSNHRYGGCTTFTAHLLNSLDRKLVYCLTEVFENDSSDFGYGLQYQRKNLGFLSDLDKLFIADMYRNFHILDKLKDKEVTIVIHDPGELFKENIEYVKDWNVIVIRKSVKEFLKNNYGIEAKFLYHPFFQYEKPKDIFKNDNVAGDHRPNAISISRIDYNKNIDLMLKANKKTSNPIGMYGYVSGNNSLVSHLEKLDFYKYYHGAFEKSFSQVSDLLNKSKFMIDLSEIPDDGGGTQYTFLEAIYNRTAIILNRKWIESVDEKYRDFKEGYNCYAVSNDQELIDLLNKSKNIDTEKVVQNANKLMDRHIKVIEDWSNVIRLGK